MRSAASLLMGLVFSLSTVAQTRWSERMSATAMNTWPIGSPGNWNYEQGLVLRSIQTVWEKNPNATYYNYIKGKTDYFVNNLGNISTYDLASYNSDNIASGRSLHFLFNQTGLNKYRLAADRLRSQLATHPRTTDGGFWHKKSYPYQMWLDGLFMVEPFYAEYAKLYEPNAFNDVTKQFVLMEKHTRDTSTGLLYHGWNENKAQAWADPVTGCSPNVWGRAMGWFAMAVVDVIEFYPKPSLQRDTLLGIWQRLSQAIVHYQDSSNGLWYQVMDKGDSAGNFVEASASCMLVYALAKAARLGYSPKEDLSIAQKGFEGILTRFVTTDLQGRVHLTGICPVAGLGGTPYRDGSYAYYVSTGTVQDDPKGIGAFILAAVEIEKASSTPGPMGIDDHGVLSSDMRVYPNPVVDRLYVVNNQGIETFVSIQNLFGETLVESTSSEIDLKALASGTYLVTLESAISKQIVRIVKK